MTMNWTTLRVRLVQVIFLLATALVYVFVLTRGALL